VLERLVTTLQTTTITQAADIDALKARVTQVEQVNATQSADIASLRTRVVAAEAKLAYVNVQGTDMIITGANLHIRNGLGATNGNPADPGSIDPLRTHVNGLGNLVVGYSAGAELGYDRTGSHNFIVGDFGQYTSFGGIVGGITNSSLGPFGVVLTGRDNNAGGAYSGVFGGHRNNTIDNSFSSCVLGGENNTAGSTDTAILGGENNAITNRFATIAGGAGLTVGTEYGFAAGWPGFGPQFSGWFSSP
jgi:hypothetical protein